MKLLSQIQRIRRWLMSLDRPAFWIPACIILVLGCLLVSFAFWDWLSSPHESGSTTLRNVSLIIAGIIALILAIWRGRVANSQAKTAQQTLLNERYRKGVEMLGHDLLSVRLGGIYGLYKLAEEHPKEYHLQVMDLFCAFLRNPPTDGEHSSNIVRPAQDVEAILEVVRTRNAECQTIEENTGYALDLRASQLQGARLDNANMSKAKLCDADLSSPDENIINATRLDDANLARANLIRANLKGVHLNGANLQRAELGRANLSNAQLVNADLWGAAISGANLTRAILGDGGTWNLSRSA